MIKEALLEVKKIIDFYINRLDESGINDLSNSEKKNIQYLLQSLNAECNCDHYYGFDCGCSFRNFLFNESNKTLNR